MTLTLKPIRRHYVTGLSKGPQGADGVATLAREAYLAMIAAPWSDDAREAMMPVHEFDRDPPSGQAFKAVWGYDKVGRTIQSSCGAECYTYRIPSDALDDTNADGVANVATVSIRLAGDRYLDRGACVWCELSSNDTPSPISVAISSGDGVAHLATQGQVDASGAAIAPNKRHGVEAQVDVSMGGAAPAQYLHVHLFLSDYLGFRGAWIEGGAMFAADGADVAFSRDVEADAPGEGGGAVALNVGRVKITPTAGGISAADAVEGYPRASLWENIVITAKGAALAAEASIAFNDRVADMLAFIESAPALWANGDMVAAATSLAYADKGALAFSDTAVGFCCLCAHGLTNGRVFRGMTFATPLLTSIPYRLAVYGIADDLAIASAESGSTLRFATPLAYWADILSRQFRAGKAEALRIMADASLAASHTHAAAEADTESVAVQPLAARSVAGEVSRVVFDTPFASGALSSVIVALIPNGAPSGAGGTEEEYAATATRDIVASIPVAATRTEHATAIRFRNVWDDGTPSEQNPYNHITFRSDATFADAVTAVPGGGIVSSPTAQWNSAIMGISSSGFVRSNFTNVRLDSLVVSFDYNGRRYFYSTESGDPLPACFAKASLYIQRPDSATADMSVIIETSSAWTFSFVAHASDGATISVVVSSATPFALDVYSFGDTLRPGPGDYAAHPEYKFENVAYTDLSNRYWFSARGILAGYDYAFATAVDESATCSITQSGTISFVRDGVTYTAQYSTSESAQLTVANKTAGTFTPSGNDATETATITGTAGAVAAQLEFGGSDGSAVWAEVALPSASLAGNVPYQARAAYNGTASGVGTVAAAGLAGTATVRQAFVATETIDPGLITLFE